MIEIPIQPSISADQTMRIELGSKMVNMLFYYNTRNKHWALTLTDDAGKGMEAVKLVPNYPLLKQYQAQKPFAGDILLLPKDETAPKEPVYNDIGARWGVFYLTASELAEWRRHYGVE